MRLILLLFLFFYTTLNSQHTSLEKTLSEMVGRWFPDRVLDFSFEQKKLDCANDCFILSAKDNKIHVVANNGVAMASGFNWYLKHYCHVDLSIQGNSAFLPEKLPPIKESKLIATPFRYRNFFNYCTFSYTMAWYNWERWEKLIDWMAMNGVNMPLAMTGQEAVWYRLYHEMGLSDEAIKSFIVGPAFLPWGWMGNIDGLGGPIPNSWIESHKRLQLKILKRERAFGMKPILQGFTGHIPIQLKEKHPNLKYIQTTDWAGMPGTYFLDPQDPLFKKIGKRFIEIQTEFYGTDHLYDADCFNEVNPPNDDTDFIERVSQSVYESMTEADPEAIWVMQGWFLFWQKKFWKAPQAKALLGAVPDDRLILLDLYGEKYPVWNETEAFYGKQWIWNIICNNGQKVNLSGDLRTIYGNYQDALTHPDAGKLTGIGVMMEGFGYNPVVQDFMGELTWNSELQVETWIEDYATRRYGKEIAGAKEAWQYLLNSVYSYSIVGESLICYPPENVTPELNEKHPYGAEYNETDLFKAAKALLSVAAMVGENENYQFDLVHVFRELLALKANKLFVNIQNTAKNKDVKAFKLNARAFLKLLDDMDTLLASNSSFLLGKWIEDAKSWATSPEEKKYFEWNARSIVTLWQPSPDTHLRDYASKQWNGLVGDFYKHRWTVYFAEKEYSIVNGTQLDIEKLHKKLAEWEFKWIQKSNTYSSKPVGNPVEIATQIWSEYGE